jgi:hypothetical protein
MKTLKQFKQDIEIGDSIIVINYKSKTTNEIPEKMRKIRFVSYKDTTGFYLKSIDDTTTNCITKNKNLRGSYREWPKAKELEYNGNTFTISTDYNTVTYQIIT